MVNAGIYTRLSDEDRDKLHGTDESESIQNQKAMLVDYCKERAWNVYDIYCDEDYSGIDRKRPDFNRMLADCERGFIDIVLCKSQSRFSRDMEVIEKYIHNKFLEWNVRFIGVVDRADTLDVANKKARQINGLINEWYLEDTSENIRKTLDSKRKRGEFTGSFAPFGYLVNPENKNHLIIDEYAAPIVRDIFKWYLQGWGYRKIVIHLNELGIPNPTFYKKRLNSKYVNSCAEKSKSQGLWTSSTIFWLIRNETYIGNLAQGRSHFVSYKNRKLKKVPKDEWVRVSDCHEAVIDLQIWVQMQEKLGERTRSCNSSQEIHALAGKVKCAVCGNPMLRNVYYNRTQTKQYYNLKCKAYKSGAMNCSNMSAISGLQLEGVIIEQLNVWLKNYCEQDNIEIQSDYDVKLQRFNTETEAILAARAKILSKKEKLYEDKLEDVITKEEFLSFSRKCEKEIASLNDKLRNLELQAESLHQASIDTEYRKKLIDKYTCIDELTRPIAEEFIEKVVIGEKVNLNQREVTVHWKF
ncbi:MAG: recombinase family protein [Oscillospiraceae bacterium]|nr:recombinase family protein [Oscillospiraceae bacterium]